MNFTQTAKKYLDWGYIPIPISKSKKKPICKYKEYSYEHAQYHIRLGSFDNNDIAILLDKSICCLDIDSDDLTSSKDINKKIIKLCPELKNVPHEKTNHGFHYFFKNSNKLQKNIRCMTNDKLNIDFNYDDYINKVTKPNIKVQNEKYILPIDFLTGCNNGTDSYIIIAPSTNKKPIIPLIPIAQLPNIPKKLEEIIIQYDENKIKNNIIKNKKNKSMENNLEDDNRDDILTDYTEEQINIVNNNIKYLSIDRFNNYMDFFKVTATLTNISDILKDEWLKMCMLSKLWKKSTSLKWCSDYWESMYYKKYTIKTFYYFLKIDAPHIFKLLTNQKKIIDVSEIMSPLTQIDLDNYHDDKGMLKEFTDNNFLVIKSPMGSGKTYQLREYIKMKGKNKKIIILTPRVTLANEFMFKIFEGLGFKIYNDKTLDIINCEKLIIQVDSLHRMYKTGENIISLFDWVILDELEMLFNRMTEIEEKHSNECFIYLNTLLKSCSKVIALDGQLTQNSLNILSNAVNKIPYVVRNAFNKNENVLCNISCQVKSLEMLKLNKMLIDLEKEVEQNKKIFVVCNVKERALNIFDNLSKKYPNKKIYCLHGDTLQSEKERLFFNLSKNIIEYDVFITTSVLLAGNSIDPIEINKIKYNHFDKCYVFIGDNTDDAFSIHQMIRRVRCLNEKIINVNITVSGYEEIFYNICSIKEYIRRTQQFLKKSKNATQIFDLSNSFDYNEFGVIIQNKSLRTDLFTRSKYLQMNRNGCFFSIFHALCLQTGYKTNIITDEIKEKENILVEHAIRSEIRRETHFEDIAKTSLLSDYKYEEIKKNVNSIEEQNMIEKYIFTHNYKLENETQKIHDVTINNSEFIKKYYGLRKQWKTLTFLAKSLNTYDDFINDVNNRIEENANLDKTNEKDIKYYTNLHDGKKYINSLNDILKLIGFKNFGELETKELSGLNLKNNFEKNKKEILKIYNSLYYQYHAVKKDFGNITVGNWIQSFNNILNELTSGELKNVGDSKKKALEKNIYKFKHAFDDAPECIKIKYNDFKFKELDLIMDECLLNDDMN